MNALLSDYIAVHDYENISNEFYCRLQSSAAKFDGFGSIFKELLQHSTHCKRLHYLNEMMVNLEVFCRM